MKNLKQLILDNLKTPGNYRIENSSEDEATIYIYDVIGGWFGGVDANQFVRELNGLRAATINIRINSPGGDVFDGRAMATAIAQHPSNVVAHVDGLAASAASWIALAADEVRMSPGSFLMIHNTWSIVVGDKHTMTEEADVLNKIDATFVADYARKTGLKTDEIVSMMDQETWIEAEEAVTQGFADTVSDNKKAANNWNLSAFNNVPESLIEPPADNLDELEQRRRENLQRHLSMLEKIAS